VCECMEDKNPILYCSFDGSLSKLRHVAQRHIENESYRGGRNVHRKCLFVFGPKIQLPFVKTTCALCKYSKPFNYLRSCVCVCVISG